MNRTDREQAQCLLGCSGGEQWVDASQNPSSRSPHQGLESRSCESYLNNECESKNCLCHNSTSPDILIFNWKETGKAAFKLLKKKYFGFPLLQALSFFPSITQCYSLGDILLFHKELQQAGHCRLQLWGTCVHVQKD